MLRFVRSACVAVLSTALLAAGLGPAAAAEAVITLSFDRPGPYIEGQQVDFTVTSSDSAASGVVTVEASTGDGWEELGSIDGAEGVAEGSFTVFANAEDGPQVHTLRAVWGGVASAGVEFTDRNLEATITNGFTVAPGADARLQVSSNATYIDYPAVLYFWDPDSEQWLVYDDSVPVDGGAIDYTIEAPDRSLSYCFTFLTQETRTEFADACTWVEVYSPWLQFSNNAGPMNSLTVDAMYNSRMTTQVWWGGFDDRGTVTLQYREALSTTWRTSSVATDIVDGYAELRWTAKYGNRDYRVKAVSASGTTSYSGVFQLSTFVDINLSSPRYVLEGKSARVRFSQPQGYKCTMPSAFVEDTTTGYMVGWELFVPSAAPWDSRSTWSWNFTPEAERLYHLDVNCYPLGPPAPFRDAPYEAHGIEYPSDAGFQIPIITQAVPWDEVQFSSVTESREYGPGESVRLQFETGVPVSGTGELWYRTNGGSWLKSGSGVAFVDGVATRTVNPVGTRDYRVRFAGKYSDVVTLSPGGALPTLSEPEPFVPGGVSTLLVELDEVVSGEAALQYRDGSGAWRTSSRGVDIVDGVGTREVTPVPGRSFRVIFSGHVSGVVTPSPAAIAVVAAGPSSYVAGQGVELTFVADPAVSGAAALWYRTDGAAWRMASSGVTFVDGVASRAVSPSGDRDYKVVFFGSESNVVSMSPMEVAVTLTEPVPYVPGENASLVVELNEPLSGEADLQYRDGGGVWRTSSRGVDIVDGEGTRAVRPDPGRQFRVVFAGAVSDVVEPTAAAVTIVGDGPASYVAGQSVTISFTADPAVSGSAALLYRTDGGAWITANSGVTFVEGVATRSVRPSGSREYKVVLAGNESSVVSVTPAGAPDIVATAPAYYDVGTSVVVDVTVDPATSGSAELWYRSPGGVWRQSSVGVDIVEGVGSRTLNPSGIREYLVRYAGGASDAVVLTPSDLALD